MSGTNWTTYGTSGTGTGQFQEPGGIVVDSANKIYIADTANDRIVRIDDMSGTNWTTLGTWGTGEGTFADPTYIYIQ
jgi:DNA-binding beta-propeller fold protein YncE